MCTLQKAIFSIVSFKSDQVQCLIQDTQGSYPLNQKSRSPANFGVAASYSIVLCSPCFHNQTDNIKYAHSIADKNICQLLLEPVNRKEGIRAHEAIMKDEL